MFDEAKNYEVNGPLFDAGLGEVEPEDAEEVAYRKRLIAQASRRVKRAEDDQTLITALSNQVEKERDREDHMATELTNYHEASRAIRQTLKSFRIKRVIYSDNLLLRNKELEETVARIAAIVEARDSEIGTLKALIDIRNEEINGLEENQTRTREELKLAREERERLQLRYNELGLSCRKNLKRRGSWQEPIERRLQPWQGRSKY